MQRPRVIRLTILVALVVVLSLATAQGISASSTSTKQAPPTRADILKAKSPTAKDMAMEMMLKRTTNADREKAAKLLAEKKTEGGNPFSRGLLGFTPLGQNPPPLRALPTTIGPNQPVDYFGGVIPNFANSQLPSLDASGNPIGGTGIRKFVDSLPGLGYANRNNLNQYIPVAIPDTHTYPGYDYYEIELGRYQEKLGSDIPTTTLQGYRQTNTTDTTVSKFNYLGPTIIARKGRAVRVKFTNNLPTNAQGNLFLPVDTTMMGCGTGPNGGTEVYAQNRATLHLHGGATPWISDGTPHQWTTPAGQTTSYPKGVSVRNVPDMPDPGPGSLTFFYTNQQSARLMFYHDHSYGITRLNVYSGEAAPFVLRDPVEQELINGNVATPPAQRAIPTTIQPNTIPADEIPIVVQDKTFVPNDAQLITQDPTWDKAKWGGAGNLWFPHVYMPNQNPAVDTGVNPMGRWDYGPWFWPIFPSVPGPTPAGDPGLPNPSATPEAFMDTPLVNGTAYPFVQVSPKAYRLRILNASNDRMWNLQLYYAQSNTASVDASGNPLQTASGEVPMVPAIPSTSPTWPATWPTDGRDGGVPNPTAAGPSWIQIGNEGGFLPQPAVIPPQPVNYLYDRRNIVVLNVSDKSLFLGPAERADVIVDFSHVPSGSKVILYNDAPAPVPAYDTRLDYYTGSPNQTDTGGIATTLAGYGPNTRTVMQFQVQGSQTPSFDLSALNSVWQTVYRADQDVPVVPQQGYGYPTNTYSRIQSTSLTFTPESTTTPVNVQMQPKAIQELFDTMGRMNSTLGVELPFTTAFVQTTLPFGYIDPTTENITDSVSAGPVVLGDGTQLWKITHNGVDTHAIHVHLFNVQVINRVGWDGAIRPPDANELGWKETVRMNPLEDCIVALRPTSPSLPFKIGDSVRPLDPTQPIGGTAGFAGIDPQTGQPITVTNVMTNFGWEYVWHCHLLGHEENDMMRPVAFSVSPAAPTTLTAVAAPPSGYAPKITLNWSRNWTNPIAKSNFIQRATNSAFTSNVATFSVAATATSYVDYNLPVNTTFYYRVRAENDNSYSAWTNTASAKTATSQVLMAPYSLHLISRTGTSLKFGWTIPTVTAPYTGIRVNYSRSGPSGPWSTYTLPANAVWTNVTGLRSNTKYWFQVVALGAGGTTAPSAVISATTEP